jgi:hypothetical protein
VTAATRYADQNTKRRLRRAGARAEREAQEALGTLKAVAHANSRTREIRVVRLPGGPIPLGAYAGTDIAHQFIPDGDTGTSCMGCFGWSNDYRHLGYGEVDRG